MNNFNTKAAPSDDKIRGGYYTPPGVADFLVRWAVYGQDSRRSPKTRLKVLEPSCGDGAILRSLTNSEHQITAVELDPNECSKAAQLGIGQVNNSDFFDWQASNSDLKFDAVVGNPPFIRFGNWREKERSRALAYIEAVGLRPSKLINAWLPFVIASINSVRPGGRVALVLPAELLQVSYAAETRQYLIKHCSSITLIFFKNLLFKGVLQEVVLLLAVVGEGPALFSSADVEDASGLATLEVPPAQINAPADPSEKWTLFYIGPALVEKVRSLGNDKRMSRIGDYARVNVGVVTGRNSFFCLTQEQVLSENLSQWTIPIVARSAHLSGLTLDREKWLENCAKGLVTSLLMIPEATDIGAHPELAKYLAKGESSGVHLGYKTRIRKKWWSVPSVMVPDGFMLRQVSSRVRLFVNNSGATSTDTVHRVFLTSPSVTMEQLAVASLNSISICHGEILGRSYGGGILELEPSEAVSLPLPDPSKVTKDLVLEVSSLLNAGELEEAIDRVDEKLLINEAGFSVEEVLSFRQIQSAMSIRRRGRVRS